MEQNTHRGTHRIQAIERSNRKNFTGFWCRSEIHEYGELVVVAEA